MHLRRLMCAIKDPGGGAGFGERKSAVAAAARLPLARYGYDEASVTTTDIPFIG